nr:zinc ribbon domain-containing protein [Clostridia bacterium]
MAVVRTPDELKNPDFNYYLAFQIDPKERDSKKIDEKLRTRLGNAGGSLMTRRYNELRTDIIEIMVNDSIYDAQKDSYIQGKGGRAKELAAAKKFKLDEARELAEDRCKKNKVVLRSQLDDIYNAINRQSVYFTKDEYNAEIKYLEQQTTIIEDDSKEIPFGQYEKLDDYLTTLGYENVFAFLSSSGSTITEKSPPDEIKKAKDAVYSLGNKTADMKKKQATSNLCGIVETIMVKDPKGARTYSNYLATRGVVWDKMAHKKRVGLTDMTLDEFTGFVQEIMGILGLSLAEAQKMLAIGCRYFRVVLVDVTPGQKEDYLVECPYDDCGRVFKKGLKICPHCNRSIEAPCWNCGTLINLNAAKKGCSACGATTGSRAILERKCSELDSLLVKTDVSVPDLKSKLQEIKGVVPGYEKHRNSEVMRRVTRYEASVQSRVKLEENTGNAYRAEVDKVRTLVGEKKYQTAYQMARGLKSKYSSYNTQNTDKLIADIKKVVDVADRHMEQAKQAMLRGDERNAIEYAIKVNELCSDYSDTRLIFLKFPPKTPVGIRAALEGEKVRIEWAEGAKQDYITYTVIKKNGVPPSSADDGSVLEGGISIRYAEDKNIVSAVPYYYAVYAERFGIKSSLSITPTPVSIFKEVEDAEQLFLTPGIKVTWRPPQNVASVEVWKKQGVVAPIKAGDGVKVPTDGKSFYDEKAVGENSYLIICNYRVGTQAVQSKGIRLVLKPFENIAPVTSASFSHVGDNKFAFTSDPVKTGNVYLYFSPTKPSIQYSVAQRFIDFGTVCPGFSRLTATTGADGALRVIVPREKIGYVYPIVMTDQLFVVSEPFAVNTLSGIKDLQYSFAANRGVVTVEGKLHPSAKNIVAKISHKDFPETMESEGENFTFTADDFKQDGRIEINLRTNTINYITLFVEFYENGSTTYSLPVTLDTPIDYRETVRVKYCINYKTSAVKKFDVVITYEATEAVTIPSVVLVKGDPIPLRKSAGELCERLDPVDLDYSFISKKYKKKVTVKVDPVRTGMKFEIFPSAEGGHVKLIAVDKL